MYTWLGNDTIFHYVSPDCYIEEGIKQAEENFIEDQQTNIIWMKNNWLYNPTYKDGNDETWFSVRVKLGKQIYVLV